MPVAGTAVVVMVTVIRPTNRHGLGAFVLDLELDRYMGDSEPRHLDPDTLQDVRMSVQIGDDGMPAHRHHPARHGPDVQIVHRRYPWHAPHPALDVGHR